MHKVDIPICGLHNFIDLNCKITKIRNLVEMLNM